VTTVTQDRTAPDWGRVQRVALIAGAVGLGLSALGLLGNPAYFFRSYLIAYVFWLGIALGCLAVVMIQHLTGGVWGLILRRTLEGATRTLPLLALLFVPLAFGVHQLYEWADPSVVANDEVLRHKQPYLNVPFFLARAAGYFVIWLAVAFFLNHWSAEQDATGDPHLPRRFRLLSAPGLMLYGLTVTFMAVDWLMSLEPHWYSTIYSAIVGMGQVLSGFAFALALVLLLADGTPLAGLLDRQEMRDLGNLLLAFVMVWAYLSFSQFLLIWSGNLPEETPYYIRRLDGGWQAVGALLILGHFALPFVLLLLRTVKENRRVLVGVAVGVLVMRLVDVYWHVLPAFSPEGHHERASGGAGELAWVLVLSLGTVVGIGGVWLGVFLWQLGQRPLLPLRDPYLAEVTAHD
jgi:hypothetical protein